MPLWSFDNSLARALGDFCVPWQAATPREPRLVLFNDALAARLGLPGRVAGEDALAGWLSGRDPVPGSEPVALAYAGHQFGHFNPQLGDGRALLLGEVLAPDGLRFDLQFKGSGATPFSRSADGKSTLAAALREYLISEAMAALRVPSTRSLAVVATGEGIWRETPHPAAVLTRVAASHLRIGSFEWAAAHKGRDAVAQLADYALERHYPERMHQANRPLALLDAVAEAQARLVARWMALGFVHGVMNTDNVTISGETIDYGPCAFLDGYSDRQVFSSIDHHGRYAFGQQPVVCRWNLYKLASALIEAIAEVDQADSEAARLLLEQWPARYEAHWLREMRAKLGLVEARDGDLELAQELFTRLEGQQADFTRLFRALAVSLSDGYGALEGELSDRGVLVEWHARWYARLADEGGDPAERAARMDAENPLYIPRNHLTDAALTEAEAGDLAPFLALLDAVTHPFEPREGLDRYTHGAPQGSPRHVTYCGT
ncbi:protein adenylyltransferase SelO [Novosphingobium sp.]|uniref:protein adenylyltransferase SelO n=1 Tax=Novosphingobium sp. TaxID=1874826 RepID=UPI0025D5A749|nr:YdiU family protein [Novosphingobium sp.]MCC6926496.1 YdiU family protein [Novosphingobium sp.]